MRRDVCQAAAGQTSRASSWTMGWCGYPVADAPAGRFDQEMLNKQGTSCLSRNNLKS